MRALSRRLFQTTLFAITLMAVCLRGADVSFYGVLKSEKYNQGSTSLPTLGTGHPYRFGAVVAPSVSGSVQSATVTPPGATAQALGFDLVNQWFSSNPTPKYSTEAELDAAYPTGNYTLVVNTLNQGQKTLMLNLPAETFPSAPHISNWAAAQAINPAVDFTLRWDPFAGGTTNDFILVLMGNATNGNITFRSPSPLQPGALDGLATSVTIPAANLEPSTLYQVEITFVKVKSLDKTSYPGAVGIVGFDSFTDAGLLTTASPIQFGFSFRQFAQGGSFLNNTNATPQFPVAINGYRAELIVTGTTNFASPTQVFFTGPAGSGLTNTSSGPNGFSQSSTAGFYFSPKIRQPAVAPAGNWSVSYEGTLVNFTEPDPEVASHLLVAVPRVVLSNEFVKTVTWAYFDPSGNAVAGTPAVLNWIQVQEFDAAGTAFYSSPALAPGTSSYTFTDPLAWTNLDTLRFLYEDNLNNSYIIAFPNVVVTTPTELAAIGCSAGNGFVLQVSGQAGHSYRVQFSTDLAHWTDLVTTNLSTSSVELIDRQATNSLARFYRASLAN